MTGLLRTLTQSLRARLVLAIVLLGLLFCAVLIAIQIETTRRAVREEVGAVNRIAEQLLAQVGQTAGSGGVLAVQRLLAGTGRVRANDISIYDDAGELLYRSPVSQYKAGSRAPAWFAKLVVPIIEPRTLVMPGGRVIIAAEASRATLDGWEDTRWLAGIAALFVLLSAVVVALVVGRVADRTEHQLQDSRAVHDWLQERIENERKHLAQDLHDEVAQSITAIMSIARALPALPPQQAQQAADAIADGASRLYDSMQNIVTRLRPLAIDTLGLEASLNDLIAQLRRQPGAAMIEFSAVGAHQVPEHLRLPTFRIAQEALTNAFRHANASTIWLSLSVDQERVDLQIADNGRGMAAHSRDRARKGFGLRGMRERAQAAGGTLHVGAPPATSGASGLSVAAPGPMAATGTLVHASLPFHR